MRPSRKLSSYKLIWNTTAIKRLEKHFIQKFPHGLTQNHEKIKESTTSHSSKMQSLVAERISRASVFALAAKPWTRAVKPVENSIGHFRVAHYLGVKTNFRAKSFSWNMLARACLNSVPCLYMSADKSLASLWIRVASYALVWFLMVSSPLLLLP